MGCAPWTGPSAISADPEGYKAGGETRVPRRWAARASGPSTPARSPWPTRCSARPRRRSASAERIIEELKKAEAEGKGAASLDGKMIDAASEKMARNVIDMAKAIAAREAGAGV
jgi:hypothetical protein